MRSLAVCSAVCALLVLSAGAASALSAPVVLFDETFDGATGFPGSGKKFGIPTPTDADESGWHAVRFEHFFGSPAEDVGLKRFGGDGNFTPAGLAEDDAGLVFEISTLGLSSVQLDFDWRTISATGPDRMRVGYLVAPSPFTGPNEEADFRTGAYEWSNWIQLLSVQDNTTHSASYALPAGVANLLVAFWLDGEEGDFATFDNVVVTGVPEPLLAMLLAFGLAGLVARMLMDCALLPASRSTRSRPPRPGCAGAAPPPRRTRP